MAKEQVYVESGQSHGQGPDAIKAAGLIFLAAVRGVNPATSKCDTEDVGEQTRFAMENVKAALAAAGATMDDVVRVAIYMIDMNNRAPFNKVYREYFTEDTLPARFAVQTDAVGGTDLSKFTLEVIAADPNFGK
jgi:2-iminobutanoate/2-iminopropanoate deaminase